MFFVSKFLVLLSFGSTLAQNVNVSTLITVTPANTGRHIRSFTYEPNTGFIYVAAFADLLIQMNSRFQITREVTWTGGWDGANNLGTQYVKAHPSGDVLVCGYSSVAVRGVALQSHGPDLFYHRIKPDGTFVYTVMRGGTSWDGCLAIEVSSSNQQRFFVGGFKKGNYLLADNGGEDGILLSINFVDGSLIWSYGVPGYTVNWDEVIAVAQVGPNLISTIHVIMWLALPYRFLNFDTSGTLVSSCFIPFADLSGYKYDETTNWWWIARPKRVTAIDTSCVIQLEIAIDYRSSTPTSIEIDPINLLLYIGSYETNAQVVTQVGILSGTTYRYRWASTETINTLKIVNSTLLIGGSSNIRLLPNVSWQDNCLPGTVRTAICACQVCTNGTFARNGTCQTCPVGSFCSNGIQRSCGLNSNTVIAGAGSISQCMCNDGYHVSNGTCLSCPIGAFCRLGNLTLCRSNSNTTSTHSSSSADCVCNPGYFGLNGNCELCPFGASCSNTSFICNTGFGNNSNRTGCVQCGATSYKSSASNEICTPCPPGSTCSSTGFICNAGFGINANSSGCVQCGTTNYKSSASNDGCTPCPPASTCSSTGFNCSPGFYLNNGECLICPIGKYCAGGSSIESCPTDRTTSNSGASSLQECTCLSGFVELIGKCKLIAISTTRLSAPTEVNTNNQGDSSNFFNVIFGSALGISVFSCIIVAIFLLIGIAVFVYLRKRAKSSKASEGTSMTRLSDTTSLSLPPTINTGTIVSRNSRYSTMTSNQTKTQLSANSQRTVRHVPVLRSNMSRYSTVKRTQGSLQS